MAKGRVDFGRIERKWQEKWEKAGIFRVREDPKKRKGSGKD